LANLENGIHFDMTFTLASLKGFLIGIVIFILVNLLAAHLLSDCGLPAVFGKDFCADDIVRAGFPLIFFEEGGFAYRIIFNLPNLLLDIFIGLGFSIICGFIAHRRFNRRVKE
jgi:ABC-type antimicrobial peptide transport system permease subunit